MTLAATLSRIGYCCAGWALTRLERSSGSATSKATNSTSTTNETCEYFIIISSYVQLHASIQRMVPLLPLLRRGIFLEHLGDRTVHHLHVFLRVAIVQGVLSHATPSQFFGFHVVNIHDQRPDYILFRGDTAHSATESAHSPGVVGGLGFHPAADDHDQVGILVFLHHLQALALQLRVDLALRFLRQERISDLIGILILAPGVRVITGKIRIGTGVYVNGLRGDHRSHATEQGRKYEHLSFHLFSFRTANSLFALPKSASVLNSLKKSTESQPDERERSATRRADTP